MQNDDILSLAPASKHDTDEISHSLPTAIGTVKIRANSTDGKVLAGLAAAAREAAAREGSILAGGGRVARPPQSKTPRSELP